MPIVPDTKNWTWVVERPCPEFEVTDFPESLIAAAIRDKAAFWPAMIECPSVRQRPNDSTWSPLEYAAHVSDVVSVYRERLRLMLATDDQLFPNWDQDGSAVAQAYNDHDLVHHRWDVS